MSKASDYDALKELLLYDEHKAIVLLQQELESLLRQSRDPDAIIEQMHPLFNRLLGSVIKSDRDAFLNNLSPVIGDVLKETIRDSSEEISKVIAPIMGRAIKEQVKSQREVLIDALYPIMGNMIAKYVSQTLKQTLEEINTKMQRQFSFDAVMRKIRAKIQGVSESELMLSEANIGYIETLFLIHKSSGLLMAKASREGVVSAEPEMVSAMLSAIRSFVNDWIAQENDVFELNEINYGDSKIYLEVSGSCYLAVVAKGDISLRMSEKITTVLSDIIDLDGDAIEHYAGERDTLALDAIHDRMSTLFELELPQEQEAKKSAMAEWIMLLIITVLIGTWGYNRYSIYQNDTLREQLQQKLYHNEEINLYRITVDVDDHTIILEGMVPNNYYKTSAQKTVQMRGYEVNNQIVLSKTASPSLETLEREITVKEAYFKARNGIALHVTLDGRDLNVSGKVSSVAQRDEVREHFASIPGVEKMLFDVDMAVPEVKFMLYFDISVAQLNAKQHDAVHEFVKRLHLDEITRYYPEYQLRVEGFSDGVGIASSNAEVAKARMQSMKTALIALGVDETKIRGFFWDHPPADIPQDNLAAGRSVRVTMERYDD